MQINVRYCSAFTCCLVLLLLANDNAHVGADVDKNDNDKAVLSSDIDVGLTSAEDWSGEHLPDENDGMMKDIHEVPLYPNTTIRRLLFKRGQDIFEKSAKGVKSFLSKRRITSDSILELDSEEDRKIAAMRYMRKLKLNEITPETMNFEEPYGDEAEASQAQMPTHPSSISPRPSPKVPTPESNQKKKSSPNPRRKSPMGRSFDIDQYGAPETSLPQWERDPNESYQPELVEQETPPPQAMTHFQQGRSMNEAVPASFQIPLEPPPQSQIMPDPPPSPVKVKKPNFKMNVMQEPPPPKNPPVHEPPSSPGRAMKESPPSPPQNQVVNEPPSSQAGLPSKVPFRWGRNMDDDEGGPPAGSKVSKSGSKVSKSGSPPAAAGPGPSPEQGTAAESASTNSTNSTERFMPSQIGVVSPPPPEPNENCYPSLSGLSPIDLDTSKDEDPRTKLGGFTGAAPPSMPYDDYQWVPFTLNTFYNSERILYYMQNDPNGTLSVQFRNGESTTENTIKGTHPDWASEYVLAKLNLIWSDNDESGSMHAINKKTFPFEIQFIHYKKSAERLENATIKENGIVVLCSLYTLDNLDNPALESLVNNADKLSQTGSSNMTRVYGPIDIKRLYPLDATNIQYRKPYGLHPCVKEAKFVVFTKLCKISSEQLGKLRKLKSQAIFGSVGSGGGGESNGTAGGGGGDAVEAAKVNHYYLMDISKLEDLSAGVKSNLRIFPQSFIFPIAHTLLLFSSILLCHLK